MTANTNQGVRPANFVTDEENFRHQLGKKLGSGGQGAVFATSDPNVVIKAKVDGNSGQIIQDAKWYEAFAASINEVRLLDLPHGIHIAKPVHLLRKPYCGYIMRMLSDMVPIRRLIIDKDLPLKEFYTSTGGLRRRLQLLAEAAKVLARLHSLPVVYADISPENLFVSREVTAKEVWFIDPDNMRHTVDFSRPIHTPGYGAPEVVLGGANNTLSDVYSFALLAFEVLAVLAPFEGVLLTEAGGWDEEEKDYYALAERGQVPWVEDEDDDSNYSDRGIPRSIVLSRNLRALFQQTFGREGRSDPASRPSMRRWYEVLRQAADATCTCSCKATFYVDKENHNCPFCGKERERVYQARIRDRLLLEQEDGQLEEHWGPITAHKVFDQTTEAQFLYSYHLEELQLAPTVEEAIELKFGRAIILRNLTEKEITVKNGGPDRRLPPQKAYDAPGVDGAELAFPVNETHTRHIFFKLV